MPGLFDNSNDGSGLTGILGGLGATLFPGIRQYQIQQQNANTAQQALGPGAPPGMGQLLTTNPTGAGVAISQRNLEASIDALTPQFGRAGAIYFSLHPEELSKYAAPQKLGPGEQLQAPLNLLGMFGANSSQQQPPSSQPGPSNASIGGGYQGPMNEAGQMSDEEAANVAQQYITGDKDALQRVVGRGSQGIAALNRNKIAGFIQQLMNRGNITPQMLLSNQMKFEGLTKNIGDIGKTNNALNTGVGHLDQLADVFNNLGNAQYPASNYVKNVLAEALGKAGPTNYAAVAARVAPEITRIWRGAGGAEGDIERDLETLRAANSPAQGIGAIRNIAELMNSKLEANQYQYESVFGPNSGKYMLSDKSRAGLEHLRSMGAENQQFQEGATATHPGTGQKAIFKGGRWQIQ